MLYTTQHTTFKKKKATDMIMNPQKRDLFKNYFWVT